MTMRVVGAIVICYLVGAIPVGWTISRLRGIDILSLGSGKIGFTNVRRTLGSKYAIPVLILDLLKGVVAVVIARSLLTDMAPGIAECVATLATMVGHSWSLVIWLMVKRLGGGRSVAIALGSFLMISPFGAILGTTAFVIIVLFTRYMSLGTLLSLPIYAAVIAFDVYFRILPSEYIIYLVTISIFLLWRHTSSISRLLQGTESRI